MESILTSIKKLLGIEEEAIEFDNEIVMDINTVLMSLTQIGVGPAEGFAITDDTTVWTDFVPDATLLRIEAIKSYVHLNVRLLFDPPGSSAHIESINRQIEKLEWRINVAAESEV